MKKWSGGGEESRAVSIIERRVHLLLLEARAAAAAATAAAAAAAGAGGGGGGWRVGGKTCKGKCLHFGGKDASLLPSTAAEKDPIATGERRSSGAHALEVGSQIVIMLLFGVCVNRELSLSLSFSPSPLCVSKSVHMTA